jgi:hypothetical protein
VIAALPVPVVDPNDPAPRCSPRRAAHPAARTSAHPWPGWHAPTPSSSIEVPLRLARASQAQRPADARTRRRLHSVIRRLAAGGMAHNALEILTGRRRFRRVLAKLPGELGPQRSQPPPNCAMPMTLALLRGRWRTDHSKVSARSGLRAAGPSGDRVGAMRRWTRSPRVGVSPPRVRRRSRSCSPAEHPGSGRADSRRTATARQHWMWNRPPSGHRFGRVLGAGLDGCWPSKNAAQGCSVPLSTKRASGPGWSAATVRWRIGQSTCGSASPWWRQTRFGRGHEHE